MGENSLTRWRYAVISLVCGLTLAASGDDVCLLRIVVPSLPAKAISLDDPNADFTISTDSAEIGFPTLPHQSVDDAPALLLLAMPSATSSLYPTFDSELFHPREIAITSLRC
jgi:hypothetical protein